jgi:hypothetical protein
MLKPTVGINPYYFKYDDSFWNGTKEKCFRVVWFAGGVPFTLHHPSCGEITNHIARLDKNSPYCKSDGNIEYYS